MPKLMSTISVAACCGLAATAIACGGADESSGGTRTIEGRVDSGHNLAAVEGAAVTAYRVDSDGSLKLVSEAAATTDAKGHYALTVEADLAVDSQLVVEAEADATVIGRAALSGIFAADATVTAPPIDAYGTVIADAYVDARASGSVDATVAPATFELFISPAVAAEISASAAYESDISTTARAAAAAIASWRATATAAGAGAQDVNTGFELAAEAAVDLNARLDAAASDDARDAALAWYADAFASAQADAGITADIAAQAAIAAAEAATAYAGTLSAEAKAHLAAQVATLKADLAAAAMASAAVSADVKAETDAAHADLVADIEAAASAGADAEANIADAWIAYRDRVAAAVEASLGQSEAAFDQVTAELHTAATTAATAWAALALSLDVSAAADLAASTVIDFYATATSSAQVQLLTAAGANETSANAALAVLATAYLCAA